MDLSDVGQKSRELTTPPESPSIVTRRPFFSLQSSYCACTSTEKRSHSVSYGTNNFKPKGDNILCDLLNAHDVVSLVVVEDRLQKETPCGLKKKKSSFSFLLFSASHLIFHRFSPFNC